MGDEFGSKNSLDDNCKGRDAVTSATDVIVCAISASYESLKFIGTLKWIFFHLLHKIEKFCGLIKKIFD